MSKLEALKHKHKRLMSYFQAGVAIGVALIASQLVITLPTEQLGFTKIEDMGQVGGLLLLALVLYFIPPQLEKVEGEISKLDETAQKTQKPPTEKKKTDKASVQK